MQQPIWALWIHDVHIVPLWLWEVEFCDYVCFYRTKLLDVGLDDCIVKQSRVIIYIFRVEIVDIEFGLKGLCCMYVSVFHTLNVVYYSFVSNYVRDLTVIF